jgi:hypothetical protein
MDEMMRAQAAELRKMPSSDAADWLLQHYPRGGEGIILLEHISLRKADTRRLAEQYLSGAPFAQDRPYRVFSKLLGLPGLIRILRATPTRTASDADLLAYHLEPLIRQAQDDESRQSGSAFLTGLRAG